MFEESIANLDPMFCFAFFSPRLLLSATLTKLGSHEEAIGYADKALEIDPKVADAWNNKGNEPTALNKQEKAVSCLTSIELIQTNAEI
jgi:tetratricopeptide (TPR) repeat protein